MHSIRAIFCIRIINHPTNVCSQSIKEIAFIKVSCNTNYSTLLKWINIAITCCITVITNISTIYSLKSVRKFNHITITTKDCTIIHTWYCWSIFQWNMFKRCIMTNPYTFYFFWNCQVFFNKCFTFNIIKINSITTVIITSHTNFFRKHHISIWMIHCRLIILKFIHICSLLSNT